MNADGRVVLDDRPVLARPPTTLARTGGPVTGPPSRLDADATPHRYLGILDTRRPLVVVPAMYQFDPGLVALGEGKRRW
jgi:hypothetical protein